RTTWANVEKAVDNLLSAWGPDGLRCPEMVPSTSYETLAGLLRPAGYHSAKPRKLQNLARFVIEEGGVEKLAASKEDTHSLREKLLQVWGVGPETADAILLYALDRPVFVA